MLKTVDVNYYAISKLLFAELQRLSVIAGDCLTTFHDFKSDVSFHSAECHIRICLFRGECDLWIEVVDSLGLITEAEFCFDWKESQLKIVRCSKYEPERDASIYDDSSRLVSQASVFDKNADRLPLQSVSTEFLALLTQVDVTQSYWSRHEKARPYAEDAAYTFGFASYIEEAA